MIYFCKMFVTKKWMKRPVADPEYGYGNFMSLIFNIATFTPPHFP